MKPSELLRKPGSWCQGLFAKDEYGRFANENDAVRWCVVGALAKCYPDIRVQREKVEALHAVLRPMGFTRASKWNDAPGRTHKQVLAALRKAGL